LSKSAPNAILISAGEVPSLLHLRWVEVEMLRVEEKRVLYVVRFEGDRKQLRTQIWWSSSKCYFSTR